MNCPFYGKHAVAMEKLGGVLVDSGGNQCAIIARSFSPCVMEVWLGKEPDSNTCELLRSVSIQRELYEYHGRRAMASPLVGRPAEEGKAPLSGAGGDRS